MENIEIWKDVLDFEGKYMVSNFGRIKSLKRQVTHSKNKDFTRSVSERILSQSKNKQGYFKVGFKKEKKHITKLVHHLVAESFLNHTKRTNYVCVDHINENKQDNRLENLQIISKKENTKKSYYNNLKKQK